MQSYYTNMYIIRFSDNRIEIMAFIRLFKILKESISGSIGSAQLKFCLNMQSYYYTYMYTKFGDNWMEMTTFIRFYIFGGNYFRSYGTLETASSVYTHTHTYIVHSEHFKFIKKCRFFLVTLHVTLCSHYFCNYRKRDPRPKWTTNKHISDNSKKCLSVGNSGIPSVSQLQPTPAYEIFTKAYVYYSS